MSKSSLLVVGSVALDSVETRAGKRTEVLGGAATFVSAAASFLAPTPVRLVGVVGDDFDEAPVSVEAVVAVLRANVAGARDVVRRLGEHVAAVAPCGCARAAAHAIITAPDAITAEARVSTESSATEPTTSNDDLFTSGPSHVADAGGRAPRP